jgi:hypothetical protein
MLAALLAAVLVAQGPTPQPKLFNLQLPAPAIFPGPAARCSGVDPELMQMSIKGVEARGKYDRYELSGEVKNVGHTPEPADFPQSVEVYRDGHRLSSLPISRLAAGQSGTIRATVDVPHDERHPYFTFRLSDDPSKIPAPKRCTLLHDSLEIHV